MGKGRHKDSEHNHSKVTVEHIKAAVRGMWRMGATVAEISLITYLSMEEVKKIINEYKLLYEQS